MSRVLAISTAFLFGALAAPTLADPPETIQACYKNTSGRVRIVADTAECHPTRESPIMWPGLSETPQRMQLVGFTSATFQGNEGVLVTSPPIDFGYAYSEAE